MNRTPALEISVVVPIYNERENVRLLYKAIKKALEGIGKSYEIILVDDGSKDGTREILRELAVKDQQLKVILFRRNFGQSAAMAAGFRASKGRRVVAMDGDLQNDPADIPALLDKMDDGYDVVSGWRKNRKDTFLIRKLPSRIANRMICSVTDVQLHDTGCSLKAFRREVIDRIRLYGELHRFIPGLARVEGARIAEMVVNHHPRRFGTSKYNLTRTFRVLMDLASLNLFLKYLRNPVHFFGGLGALMLGIGMLGAVYLLGILLHARVEAAQINVAITTIFLFWTVGFQSLFFGLVASLIVRTGSRRGGTLSPFLTRQSNEDKES